MEASLAGRTGWGWWWRFAVPAWRASLPRPRTANQRHLTERACMRRDFVRRLQQQPSRRAKCSPNRGPPCREKAGLISTSARPTVVYSSKASQDVTHRPPCTFQAGEAILERARGTAECLISTSVRRACLPDIHSTSSPQPPHFTGPPVAHFQTHSHPLYHTHKHPPTIPTRNIFAPHAYRLEDNRSTRKILGELVGRWPKGMSSPRISRECFTDSTQPDLKKVAEAYGHGATYHTMEGFSRKLKAKAEARLREMEEEKSSGSEVAPAPAKRTPKKSRAVPDGMFRSLSPSRMKTSVANTLQALLPVAFRRRAPAQASARSSEVRLSSRTRRARRRATALSRRQPSLQAARPMPSKCRLQIPTSP